MVKPMKIAILGEGITAKAVKEKLEELNWPITDPEHAELVIVSPGIPPWHHPETKAEIISEVEFAYRLFNKFKQKVALIGITGTNGKTTVTALMAHILDIPVAGNIGIPLISYVKKEGVRALSVELSSYQLEPCTTFRPHVAILLNVQPDHMDRHKTMEQYAEAKAHIIQAQKEDDFVIYHAEDPLLSQSVKNTRAQKIPFASTDPEIKQLNHMKLMGPHNRLNALAAWKAARALGLKDDFILERINSFEPIEHRLEKVLSYQGRTFYNDSKATNPQSTIVAVESFSEPIHLLLGGKDKGLALEELMAFLHERVSSIVVFGAIADRVLEVSHKVNPKIKIYRKNVLEEAVLQAYSLSDKGEIILFAPACSSFDQFNNFEHRGQVFKEIVNKHYGKRS